MGTLLDAFSKEDRVEVTFSDFYRLIRESTSAEPVSYTHLTLPTKLEV